MQTAEGLMSRINQLAHHNGNIQNKDVLEAIKNFERNIQTDIIKKISHRSVNGLISIQYACDLIKGHI